MEKRIVVVNRDNKISRIFDPEKGLLTSTESKSENKNEDAIYVCEVTGHMMKLEQVDNVGVYANKTDIYSAKEKILSAIKEKISNDEGQFYITRQYIKYAYEHFICADGSKCNDNELPQLRAAYDAITNQKLNSDEPNKQIAKLMSEALVEIAILRPLYWMDCAQKRGIYPSTLPMLKEALTRYQNVVLKNKINALEAEYNVLKTKDLPALRENLINMIELRKLDLKVLCIQGEIKDESKKLPAVKKFFR